MSSVKEKILESLNLSTLALNQLSEQNNIDFIEKSGLMIAECFKRGNKLIIAGNGGSLCDAAHCAEEFTGFFRKYRPALPAIALSDPGHLTCVGNDLGFEYIFSRGIEAFGKSQDVFMGLTTSGNSLNLVNAFEQAKKQGLFTIAFLGKNGGKIKGMADLEIVIDEMTTSDRIQEVHMVAIHIIIELVEHILFYSKEGDLEKMTEELLVLSSKG